MDSGRRPPAAAAIVPRRGRSGIRPDAGDLPDGRAERRIVGARTGRPVFAGGWITGGRVARYREDRSYDRTILGFPQGAEAPGMTLLQAYESRVVADPAGVSTGGGNASRGVAGDLRLRWRSDRSGRGARPPFKPVWRQGRSRGGRAVMSLGPGGALRIHGSCRDGALPVRPVLRAKRE